MKATISHLRNAFGMLKETATAWMDHRAPRLGAALAFYTLFAIAPLFLIVLAIAGMWFGAEAARNHLFNQISDLVGRDGAKAIEGILAAADKPKSGAWAAIVAIVTLLVGSTGVFVQLQGALNTIWNVRKKPGQGLRYFVRARLLSFAAVLAMGFLLLVSLVINAVLSAFGKYMSGVLPAQETIWQIINFLVSFGVVTMLFAMIFRLLPDVRIAWHDVWIGAMITALLFNVGKLLLGLYLGKSSAASAYGAAGSLVIVLMWVYYSSQILFFGAEFTRVYASRCGSHLKPAPGSEFVSVKEVKLPARSRA